MVTNGCSTSLLNNFKKYYFMLFVIQMTFDENQFSVVLDKGTIDALMSNKSEQV